MKKLNYKPIRISSDYILLVSLMIYSIVMSVILLNVIKVNAAVPKIEYIPKIQLVYIQKTQAINEPIIEKTLIVEEPRSTEQIIDGFVDDIFLLYPNVEPSLIKSIIWHESTYDAKAINYNGTCLGLMQVSSYWHKDRMKKLGVTDLFNPYDNILVGVDYLSELFEKYESKTLVLMLYNMGHNKAFELHRKGIISKYAKSVIARAEEFY